MKITLLSDDSIRYEPAPGLLTIDADSAERQYSPFHMLGSSLAVCTFSVLASWATHANIPFDDLVIDVSWTFAEKPHRLDTVKLAFTWKSLPPNRLEAAKRAAALCPIHATLSHGHTAVSVEGAVA
ncbi:OsmC family protein [Gemmatirosa kalamazoonensis]|uniref:OsmC family protein n=1 Tax=Gemmatirosa kalamazoonensis TaxID=861299 RepID=W0RM09_9BACT|nr:OsmC family protein [Gemmatirosa kalamazoonensis]AHG91781.1 OsmC family protein [Gemmatirosa kalamazoonensis]